MRERASLRRGRDACLDPGGRTWTRVPACHGQRSSPGDLCAVISLLSELVPRSDISLENGKRAHFMLKNQKKKKYLAVPARTPDQPQQVLSPAFGKCPSPEAQSALEQAASAPPPRAVCGWDAPCPVPNAPLHPPGHRARPREERPHPPAEDAAMAGGPWGRRLWVRPGPEEAGDLGGTRWYPFCIVSLGQPLGTGIPGCKTG